MSFSNLFFIYLFLPVCLIFYYISGNLRYRNAVLLIFSLIFYAWGKPTFLPLILASALMNYWFGRALGASRDTKLGKGFLAAAVVLNLGVLVAFKYTGFLVENFNALTGLAVPVPEMPLPLGISFFTFEILSYLLDCWWGKTEPERRFTRFLLYVSLFPNVTSGPIVRYAQIRDELENRKPGCEEISEGISRIVTGLAKKVLIADTLSAVAAAFIGETIGSTSVLGCWYGVIVYSLQMYFDFSGYSDIAIGIALMFGMHYPENFNYPFVSKTITEFWQRWHITLGGFFRDYLLYVPIFGKQRKFGGLFLVWFCTGLWHGASWNYIIWGLYFGVFILIETLLGKKRIRKIPVTIRHIYAKLVIVVGFGIFYCTDGGQLANLFRGLVGLNGTAFADSLLAHSIVNNIFLLTAALLFSAPILPWIRKKLSATESGETLTGVLTAVFNIVLLICCSIVLVNSTNHPFLYVNF